MNAEANHENELLRLCGLVVDGGLEDADLQRLSELLASDASARVFYRGYVDAHARLLLHYEPVPVVDEPGTESVERRATQREPSAGRESWFNSAAALAIVVLVWMNLSLSATTATDLRMESVANATEIDRSATEIQELLPELSETEARRQARLLRSLKNLIVRPESPPSFTQRSPSGLGRLSE